jgi:DNA-nicking Smr family endonuclease
MSKGGKSGQGGRPIAPDDAELWDRLAASVDKVKAKPRVTPHANPAAPNPPPPQPPRTEPKSPARAPLPTAPPPPTHTRHPPPLAEFDRRAARQVASGKIATDGRLDLHGTRRRDARAQLHAFLRASQEQGYKTVLIITGKGDEPAGHRDHLADALGEPQRGVLRRLVPQWLEEPELRSVVLSFTSAGARHGGSGALYVQLRKRAR